ncbi:hypothetical protein CHLNCDRAFT_140549 [Chlorella variabilis]|uniref:Replication protein A C-terminal domain-containing protein n=1 Tax=Chlorella variabilis TaxID=554065 RepID=E1Z5N1_CHLVA|nr:hypothetical protein CHLNCDRAFT_140549 [Chlorella variabilis]EFN58502.1 hypothetical protein CHLNCDRAFT_140549 [Chlorella variabilis]|eukprot:XP_005850604.1 hypothetical protein CHLNCDRAFT_140549 [Chlorella variabilis]
MYGGGGFGETGASQQAGGGGGGGASGKKNYDSKQQTLRALTIKQLHDANSTRQDDTLLLDGKEITNVTLVGKVLSTSESGLTFGLKIDDGTGKADVKIWISEDDSELEKQRRAEWRAGMYVRVHGHISNFGRTQDVLAFNIRTVTDHNEVTYHFLQCIFQHVHLTKGGGDQAGAAAAPAPAAQGAYGGAAPAVAGYAAPAAAGYNPGGLTAIQSDLMTLFNAPDAQASDAGISIDAVLSRSGGRYSLVQVREAVEALQNEGHLYSTIDEHHFKSCNA